jgi:hypothetical protein
MGLRPRAFLAGGLGFAAAFIVACGGSNGLLTADESSTLSQQLDAVSSAVKAGHCGAARSAATALNNAVADLPPSVSTKLVQNLGQGAATVGQLAQQDCSGTTSSTTPTTSTTPSTTSTTPTTTSTAPSSTATTPHTETNPATGTATNGGGGGTSTQGSGGAGLTATNGNGQ